MLTKILAAFQSLLYLISSLLLYPVIISLVLLFFWILFELGKTVGEVARRKERINVNLFKEDLSETIKNFGKDEARVALLLHKWEEKLYEEIDRLRIVVRISPSLGLMGTLIPMSSGLASLSKGNIDQLISSLIVALTTTVVGLAVAVIAYIIGSVKQKWIDRELKDMEFIAEEVFRNGPEIHENKKESSLHKG